MIKWLIIGLIVFIGIIDICLIIACHRFEERYQYYEEERNHYKSERFY